MTAGGTRNIAEPSDIFAFLRAQTALVELRLWLDGDDPVSRRLGANAQGAVAFVGWLGLLGLLEGLVASGLTGAPSGGPGGQLAAGGDPELGEHV